MGCLAIICCVLGFFFVITSVFSLSLESFALGLTFYIMAIVLVFAGLITRRRRRL